MNQRLNEESAISRLGGLTSVLHRYMDEAGIEKADKVQRRVRMLALKHQQALLEIKALRLQIEMLTESDGDESSEVLRVLRNFTM